MIAENSFEKVKCTCFYNLFIHQGPNILSGVTKRRLFLSDFSHKSMLNKIVHVSQNCFGSNDSIRFALFEL